MKRSIIQIIIAVLLILAFLTILYLVATKKSDKMDNRIYQKVATFINPKNTRIMKIITLFGSTIGVVFGVMVSYFLLNDLFDFYFLIESMIGEVIMNNIIKIIVGRIRPSINPLVVEKGHSFPSGHTMAATAFFGFLIFFLWKSSLATGLKILLTVIGTMIILLVLISRVYLGVHYSSDVLAGLLLSIAYVLLMTYYYTDMKRIFRVV